MSLSRTLFPPPSYLVMPASGINISDHSVKCITFDHTKRVRKIKYFADLPLPIGTIENGDIKKSNALVRALKKIREDLETSFVRVSIPEEKAYLFTVTLPNLNKDEMKSAIELQLAEHVPLDKDQVVFDFDVVSHTSDSKHVHVPVTALPKTVVAQYEMILKEVGLIPLSFEIEAQSIARAIISEDTHKTAMIIDIGRTRTGVSIVEDGIVRYTSTLTMGGDMFSSAIQKHLNTSFEEADELKQAKGFLQSEKSLYEILVNTVSAFKDEINRRLDYWESLKGDSSHTSIEEIIVCGGNATVPGLVDHLGTQLKIKISLANVWTNAFSLDTYIPQIPFNESLGYASAVGLALSKEF